MFNILKWLSLSCLLGMVGGGVLVHKYEQGGLDSFKSVAVRGYCAGEDIVGNFYWFTCQDAYIAASLQQHAVEHDRETALIIADMGTNQPKKRKK